MTTATRHRLKNDTPFAPTFVEDHVAMSAPELPKGRPPTKTEAWAHYSHIHKGRKSDAEMKAFVRSAWAWAYCWYVNFKDWRKHPDWVEGQPVIAEATPTEPFDHQGYEQEIERLWQIARAQTRRAA